MQNGKIKSISRVLDAHPDTTCIFCGEEIDLDSKDYNVEHILPQALYKWAGNGDKDSTLYNAINCSLTNVALVHKSCNRAKGYRIINPDEFSSLCTNAQWVKDYTSLYKSVKSDIEKFEALKAIVQKRQRHKCFLCHRFVGGYMTLRRKDDSKPRTLSNAILVCDSCNFADVILDYRGKRK